MTESSLPPIADLVPETRPLPVPAERRPAARPPGAPPGNLNALKHGRTSRFRDLLPPEPVSGAAARRLLSREQRIAERHAANLLALARLARYRADCADRKSVV